MKNVLSILMILMVSATTLISQNAVGDWEGKLKVQGMELTILFHIRNIINKWDLLPIIGLIGFFS